MKLFTMISELQQRDILSKTKTGYYGRHKFSRWRGFVIRA